MANRRGSDDTLSATSKYRIGKKIGRHGMMDYYGFVRGFAALFIVAPFFVGAGAGALLARRSGRRGRQLILPAIISGLALLLLMFGATVIFLRP